MKTSNLTRKKGQALLYDELKKAKEEKDNAKKAAKQAAKVAFLYVIIAGFVAVGKA